MACFWEKGGGLRAIFASTVSQLPSAQNNQYTWWHIVEKYVLITSYGFRCHFSSLRVTVSSLSITLKAQCQSNHNAEGVLQCSSGYCLILVLLWYDSQTPSLCYSELLLFHPCLCRCVFVLEEPILSLKWVFLGVDSLLTCCSNDFYELLLSCSHSSVNINCEYGGHGPWAHKCFIPIRNRNNAMGTIGWESDLTGSIGYYGKVSNRGLGHQEWFYEEIIC